MVVKINTDLIELYNNCKRDVEYSLSQLLDSIPNEYSKNVIDIFDEFTLKENSTEYEIEDCLINKIIEKFEVKNKVDKVINLLVWIAFLFPEI